MKSETILKIRKNRENYFKELAGKQKKANKGSDNRLTENESKAISSKKKWENINRIFTGQFYKGPLTILKNFNTTILTKCSNRIIQKTKRSKIRFNSKMELYQGKAFSLLLSIFDIDEKEYFTEFHPIIASQEHTESGVDISLKVMKYNRTGIEGLYYRLKKMLFAVLLYFELDDIQLKGVLTNEKRGLSKSKRGAVHWHNTLKRNTNQMLHKAIELTNLKQLMPSINRFIRN